MAIQHTEIDNSDVGDLENEAPRDFEEVNPAPAVRHIRQRMPSADNRLERLEERFNELSSTMIGMMEILKQTATSGAATPQAVNAEPARANELASLEAMSKIFTALVRPIGELIKDSMKFGAQVGELSSRADNEGQRAERLEDRLEDLQERLEDRLAVTQKGGADVKKIARDVIDLASPMLKGLVPVPKE